MLEKDKEQHKKFSSRVRCWEKYHSELHFLVTQGTEGVKPQLTVSNIFP